LGIGIVLVGEEQPSAIRPTVDLMSGEWTLADIQLSGPFGTGAAIPLVDPRWWWAMRTEDLVLLGRGRAVDG
jgi:hypothetical protein